MWRKFMQQQTQSITSSDFDGGKHDVHTASEMYRSRFAGEVGKYFLERQAQVVNDLLDKASVAPRRVLEVGGGHGHLTEDLLKRGYEVVVHGSEEVCFTRLYELREKYPEKLSFVVGPLLALPFEDKSFDAVISIRLISHVEDTHRFVSELARVAKHQVLVDFAPVGSFNLLYPLMFMIKQNIEGSTRTFLRHKASEIRSLFRESNFRVAHMEREFFFPMVLHRAMKRVGFSRFIERLACSSKLTSVLGSPVLLIAEWLH